ncbi:DUF655 domain-containing protein [Candidatus Woesearchaeota archaeon]|nr:DUF655 domain-containing protein [Candidatus Woesearchaeota archaeon]
MAAQQQKEEYAIILDFLPNGYPFDTRPSHRKSPIAQAIGKRYFYLLELIPKKESTLQLHEEVYLGEGKRDKIHHILGRIPMEKLTQTAKGEASYIVDGLVSKDEQRFVAFFNSAGPITARRHQIELLPGIGKKHMLEILEKRKEAPFTSFEDIKKRLTLMPEPKKIIIKRVLMELNEEDKYRLFVGV